MFVGLCSKTYERLNQSGPEWTDRKKDLQNIDYIF